MTSSRGTDEGKLSSVGSRTVKIGIENSIFDVCFRNNTRVSLALCMTAKDVRKKIHSIKMFVRPIISTPPPYH